MSSRPYYAVADRANHRCEYCRAPESIFNSTFEVEHIVPSSLGGDNTLANLALACRWCNQCKSDIIMGVDSITQEHKSLFHPRDDSWEEHFEADLATGEILGKTATGRVTISILQMNAEIAVFARRLWIRWEVFP
jgi:HNH endonuclease